VRTGRPLVVVAVAAALALVAAGCSSGGGGNVRAPLPDGQARAATGTPITFGMINMEGSPIGSFPELRRAAEAAVRYVNEELGGVHNHPIRLETCVTDGTSPRSQACAQQLLAKDPLLVLGGVDLAAGVPVLIFGERGIPYVGATPTLGEELTSPGSYMVAGGAAADLLAMAQYVTGELKARKVSVVHVDLPGLLSSAVEGARRVMAKRGVTDLRIVAEKADAADFTPALNAAAANDPDVILAVFGSQGCARIMQAKQALGLRARMFYPSSCAGESVLQAAGSGAEGAYLASGFVPYSEESDPEVALYLDRLARYGDGGRPSVLSQAGFSLVVTVHRLLSGLDEASLTSPAVGAALARARNQPGFMSHSFTCDGNQVLFLRAMCNPWARILQFRSGRLHDVGGDWVSGAGLLELLLS
jgi:branched-chain amino acid transport system substrate-binding protein